MNPNQHPAPSPEEPCLTALEWALADSKAQEQETQSQLDTLINGFSNIERLILEQKQPPISLKNTIPVRGWLDNQSSTQSH